MASALVPETGLFLFGADAGAGYSHCPSLAFGPAGAALAAWYAYPETEHRGGRILLSRLDAKGWSRASAIDADDAGGAGNPVLFRAGGRLGLLFVSLPSGGYWHDGELRLRWSEDEGRSWTPAASLGLPVGTMVRHPPLELSRGRLLLPAYEEKSRRSLLLASEPPYRDWEVAHRFEDEGLIQPVLVAHGDGTMSAFFRPTTEPRVVWRAFSDPRRGGWSRAVRTTLTCPLSGISAFALGDGVVAVHNDTQEHRRTPLSAAWSPDRGRTWESRGTIDTGPIELSYPCFLPAPDGTVHGVYTYGRRMIKHVRYHADALRAPAQREDAAGLDL